MASNAGTCRWTYQVQKMWSGPSPDRMKRVVDTTEFYTCQWLDGHGDLPPPIRRMHGGFDLRSGDCDACTRYEPAGSVLLAKLK